MFYNAGMSERIVRPNLPALKVVFQDLDSVEIFGAGRESWISNALAVIRYRAKAEAATWPGTSDIVKPDRHLVRLAQYLGYASPDELVQEIVAETGERAGLIDFVLWRWLSWAGSGPGDLEAAVRKTGWR